MNMRKSVLDTNIFNKLVLLSSEDISKLRRKFELLVTNVSIKELERMEDGEEKEQIFKVINEYFKIIDARIFTFSRYTDSVSEDSAGGFARYNSSHNGGRMLRYKDGNVVKEVGLEKRKILKGTAFNDAAIALAADKNAVLVTDDKIIRNKLKRCDISAVSFDEFVQL